MKICKSCDEPFNPDQAVEFDVDSEEMMEELLEEHAKEEKCFDCIFDLAFYHESMRTLDS